MESKREKKGSRSQQRLQLTTVSTSGGRRTAGGLTKNEQETFFDGAADSNQRLVWSSCKTISGEKDLINKKTIIICL